MNMKTLWRFLFLLFLPVGIALSLSVRAAVPAWDMTGTYTISYGYACGTPPCLQPYVHDMTITSMDMVSGEFAGNGSYPAGAATPTYTWPVEGKVAGSDIYFELGYNELPGHMVWSLGTIDANGLASGSATDTLNQSLVWSISPAAHFKAWDGNLRSMGYYKQTWNRLTGTVFAYVSSCVTKDVDSVGPSAGTAQTFTVLASQKYKVTSVGTYSANDGIYADAKYSSRNSGPWRDDVESYESYGPFLLDLRVDWVTATYNSGVSPDWGMYNPMHSYAVGYNAGAVQTTLSMGINDVYAVNNAGVLTVTVCGPTAQVSVDADAVWAAFGAYSSSAWTKFLAQYGVTVFNLRADPALGLAVFYKNGNAFSGKSVSELVLIGASYTVGTSATDLLALKDVFDWINNRMYVYY